MDGCVTLQPPKPRQIVTVPGKVDACTILPQPLTPSTLCRGSARARSTRSIGDPLGLDRLERLNRSGIPAGSIDSIDRGSLRGDPLGLDRIDSIDRGSPRARSTRSIEDPLGLDVVIVAFFIVVVVAFITVCIFFVLDSDMRAQAQKTVPRRVSS